ncbi:MAG TPA: GNAT family N-acetyltransferase [Candidatus Limnocylindrales bacterium]
MHASASKPLQRRTPADPKSRTEGEPGIRIEALTPDRLDDLAGLFDQPGDPKWCWCASFHITGNVKARPREDNREVLTARTVEGPSPGLLGYRDGRVVAWVSVGPRASYRKLANRDYADAAAPGAAAAPTVAGAASDPDQERVWSIVCFVVDPRERRRGVARAMLAAAVEHARAAGATAVEAYAIDPLGERIPNPIAYGGMRSMFEAAGFRVVGERLAGRTRWPRPVVRLDL